MEVLGGIGGAAAISQLLDAVVKTGASTLRFIEGFKDIPEELRRLKNLLISIQTQERTLRDYLDNSKDHLHIQTYFLSSLQITLLEVQKDINAVAAILKRYNSSAKDTSLPKRISFHVRHQHLLAKSIRHLNASAYDLQRVANSIHLSLAIYLNTAFRDPQTSNLHTICRSSKHLAYALKIRYALSKWNASLQDWGFYGCIAEQKDKYQECSEISVSLGLCVPTLSLIHLPNAWTLIFTFKRWSFGGEVQPRHRIPAESTWIKASADGNVRLMQQLLEDGKAGIDNQTICSGKTALMIAIETRQMASVEFLLQQKADPNIPDDDQILPIFAVVGMDLRKSQFFDQFPPTWEFWLDALRLLIDSGASTHEIVRDKTLAGLNIAGPAGNSKVLPYLQLLAAEDALDLGTITEFEEWSLFRNVADATEDSVDAFKLIIACQLSLRNIMFDGQTVLHIVAQSCSDRQVLTYLLPMFCIEDINVQDRWGWTPLHYTVTSPTSAEGSAPYANTVLLLQSGADPSTRGRANPANVYRYPANEFTCFELLKHNRHARFELLVNTLKDTGIHVDGVTDEADVFYDADQYPIAQTGHD